MPGYANALIGNIRACWRERSLSRSTSAAPTASPSCAALIASINLVSLCLAIVVEGERRVEDRKRAHLSRQQSWQNTLTPRSPREPDSIERTWQPRTASSPTPPPCQLSKSNPPPSITRTTLVDQHLSQSQHHQRRPAPLPEPASTSSAAARSARWPARRAAPRSTPSSGGSRRCRARIRRPCARSGRCRRGRRGSSRWSSSSGDRRATSP
jgi:hypothetical protein